MSFGRCAIFVRHAHSGVCDRVFGNVFYYNFDSPSWRYIDRPAYPLVYSGSRFGFNSIFIFFGHSAIFIKLLKLFVNVHRYIMRV